MPGEVDLVVMVVVGAMAWVLVDMEVTVVTVVMGKCSSSSSSNRNILCLVILVDGVAEMTRLSSITSTFITLEISFRSFILPLLAMITIRPITTTKARTRMIIRPTMIRITTTTITINSRQIVLNTIRTTEVEVSTTEAVEVRLDLPKISSEQNMTVA